MLKNIITGLLLILSLLFMAYLVPTGPKFPTPPPDSVQSKEDADIESPERRAYFTNYTREQVIAHYQNQFRWKKLTLTLNYPPENAQTLIRDQTRSVYLQELVHPFRESVYINGFEARVPKDDIWYKGIHYNEKITIRYVPSNLILRVTLGILTCAFAIVIARKWLE